MTDEDLHYDFKMSSVMTLPRAQVLYTLFLRCVEVPGDVVEFGAYHPTCVALNKCFELVSPGGMVVIDDYGTEWTGAWSDASSNLVDTAKGGLFWHRKGSQ